MFTPFEKSIYCRRRAAFQDPVLALPAPAEFNIAKGWRASKKGGPRPFCRPLGGPRPAIDNLTDKLAAFERRRQFTVSQDRPLRLERVQGDTVNCHRSPARGPWPAPTACAQKGTLLTVAAARRP